MQRPFHAMGPFHALNEDERKVLTAFETISLPFYLSLLFIWSHLFHVAFCLIATNPRRGNLAGATYIGHQSIESHIKHLGGARIFLYMIARLVGCLTLVGTSMYSLYISYNRKGHLPPDVMGMFLTYPELYMLFTYLYCSILAIASVTLPRWSKLTSRYNTLVLLSVFLVYAYRDIWPLATIAERPADISDGKLLWFKLLGLFLTAIIIPLFMPRRHVPVFPKEIVAEPNEEQTCSWLSLLTYTFLDPIIFKASRVPHLKYDQLPPQADYDRAMYLTSDAFKHLDPFQGAKRRHIFYGLMHVFRFDYMILASMLCIQAVAEFLAPLGINRLLNYLETDGQEAKIRPWFWILCIFCGPLFRILALQFYIFIATRGLVRAEGIITQLVFEHSLRIRLIDGNNVPSSSDGMSSDRRPTTVASGGGGGDGSTNVKGKNKAETTSLNEEAAEKKNNPNLIGKINNLVTTDLYNIIEGRDFLVLVLFVPLQITLSMFYLYRILGWSCFSGLFVMLLLFPIPGYVAKLIQETQKTRMKQTDARVQDVTEAVGVLRMIKLFGWEEKILRRIADKRDAELSSLWRTKVLYLINGTVVFLIPLLSMMATFGSYTVFMKGRLSPSKVFSSMPVFGMLRLQLGMISSLINLLIQAKVSLGRVDEFLKQTELLDAYKDVETAPLIPKPSEDVIGFKDATFAWSQEPENGNLTPTRRSFKLQVNGELFFRKGCINLIIGPTGSGKTSMLMALLGEMHFIPSNVESWFNLPRSGGVAYAAQESWVQNETIRENILFGSPYDEDRYRKVVRQCALERDLELFEAGDATEVGEKGLTLSGGQKARVTLARAIYSRAEILLLDDVLAALDVHTSAWIIDRCFKGDLIKGRTILLVTHNIALASPIADFVVSIGNDGSIQTQETKIDASSVDNNSALAKEVQLDREIQDIGNQEIPSIASEPKVDGKLIVNEEIAEGHVTWKSINLFLSGLGGSRPLVFFFLWMTSILITDCLNTFQVWFLGYWGSQYKDRDPSTVEVPFYLGIYSALMSSTFFYCSGQLIYIHGLIRASRIINSSLVESVLRSTLRWLDETPTGRIIARCTQDMAAVDGQIPQKYSDITELVISIVCKIVIIVSFTPLFLFPSLGVTCLGIYVGNMYLKAQMSVKREMSNARSPMLSHFSAAIAGTVSIRAYGAESAFKAVSLERVDHYVRIARVSNNLNRWIGVRIDLIGNLFTTSLAAYCVYAHSLSASDTGFSLNLANSFCAMVLMVVRFFNDFEVQANSLERIQHFIDIEHEPPSTQNAIPPASWPTSGDLRVENLCAKYSEAGPRVLHNLTFQIKSGERIGIVGRTGSGKSSLTLALLRCILTEGTVYYDGIPTSEINLDSLRSNITIIPQMPELLGGTLRRNLDLFEQHDDATLNEALRAAGLFSLQEELGEARLTLDSNISSGGSNLSVGQKQILALARAMVRGSKLLILDEATSAIDYSTDSVIQTTLRHQLPPDVTVITVAHRLHTIMDADKVMVLDGGKIAEFDSPATLLEDENGMLRALVDGSGDKATLYAMARDKRSPSVSHHLI